MNKKFYKKTKMLDSSASNPITDENVVSQEEESNQNSTVLFSKLASSATDSSSKLPGTTDLQANKTKGKRGRIASTAEPSSDTEIKKGKSTKASVVSDGNKHYHNSLLML